MTPEKQRIRIAEACGWKCVHLQPEFDGPKLRGMPPNSFIREATPDYPNDLNAMNAAESTLTPVQSVHYAEHLALIIELPDAFCGTARGTYLIAHTSAAQRAEAFLKTIGKWEEE